MDVESLAYNAAVSVFKIAILTTSIVLISRMKPAQQTRSACRGCLRPKLRSAAASQHMQYTHHCTCSISPNCILQPCCCITQYQPGSQAKHGTELPPLPCLLQCSEFSQSRQPAAARAVYIKAASGLLLAEVMKYMQAMHSSAVSSSLAAVSSEALDLDEFAGCLKPVQTQPSLSHKPITDKNQVGRQARHSYTACCTRLCPHCQPTSCTGTMHRVAVAVCRRYQQQGSSRCGMLATCHTSA